MPDTINSERNYASMALRYSAGLVGCDAGPGRRRSARDIWDEIDECSRSISTGRYKYIQNHMPSVPNDAGQAYLDLNRPAVHVMRRLKQEGKLSANEMLFMHDKKPVEESYDLKSDPDELHNLAADPRFAAVLTEMRAFEQHWLANNEDRGLEDLGERQPEAGLASVLTTQWIREHRLDLWKRLEAGELMPTQSWTKLMRADKK